MMKRLALYRERAALFVWGVWLLMLLAALGFVCRYGSNVPYLDDWDIVPTMTGHQPVTAIWLWSQHNEHRVPVPRIIDLALFWCVARDFRAGMYFNVLMMGALAFGMIITARCLRGRISYTDAFFPLLLLNWGQGLNFIWSWQTEFFLSTTLAGILLLIIARSGERLAPSAAVATGVCLLLLALCGAHGVALLPALALWLGYSAALRWLSDDPLARRDGLFTLGISLLALLMVGLYFVGWERVPYHPTNPGLLGVLRTATQFFTLGFGSAVRSVWPLSGIGALCLLLFGLALLAVTFWNRPHERIRASGLFMFLGGMASLALGLGLGRDGFEPRYITLSVPVWCCVYFIAVIYPPPNFSPKVSRVLQLVLLLAAGAALWPNTRFGSAFAKNLRSQFSSFEQEMTAGAPSHRLINRYADYLHPHHDIPNDYMPMLRQAGVGSFRFLRSDPMFREFSLPLTPSRLNQVKWEGGIAYGTGNRPHLVFSLPEQQYVSGVRLKYSYGNADGTCPYVSLYWKRDDQDDFTKDRFRKYSPTGDRKNWCHGTWTRINEPETTLIFWICDTVSQLRIHPDFKPGVFKLSEVVLLRPAGE
jgi:hypothetical protein